MNWSREPEGCSAVESNNAQPGYEPAPDTSLPPAAPIIAQPRLCRLCGERPVSPARLKAYDYRCNRCRHRSPSERATTARYNRTSFRRAATARWNAKRIFIGAQYHSAAPTADIARVINAHIKESVCRFLVIHSKNGN